MKLVRRAWRVGSLSAVLTLSLLSSSALAHDIVYFDDHSVTVNEGLQVNLRIERCCHGSGSATFDWQTLAGTAAPGSDVLEESGSETFPGPISDRPVTFRTVNDGEVEPVLIGHVELSNARGNPAPIITSPKVADVVILDEDGPSRAAFMLPGYSVYSNRASVKLEVVRLGAPLASETITWMTEDGTAKRGEHYKKAEGTVTFSDEKRVGDAPISIPILKGEKGEIIQFKVRLDVSNAADAGPTEVPVEIRSLDVGDFAKPFTDFHIPKDGATYGPNSYRAKEAHVFADDGNGSGVKAVKLALRKKMDGGGCRWWTGSRWRSGSCRQNKADNKMQIWGMSKKPRSSSFTIFKYPKLGPTQGTKIRNYRVISRATDFSANVESKFTKGFNIRTFKVRS